MSAGADRVRLQGTIFSGRSIRVNLGQGSYDGWYKATWGAKLESVNVKGSRADGRPVGQTAGEYTPDMLELDFLTATALTIKGYLGSLDPNGGNSYGSAVFTTTITFTEPDIIAAPIPLFTFRTCKLVQAKSSGENTGSETKETFSILYTDEDENGLTLYSSLQ